MSMASDGNSSVAPAWRLEWLTPVRCRWTLALVLTLGFISHLLYLHHNCPIDLSGDEAQYWDWSRNLDLSYYSKGPAIAYIIRGSCAIFGDTMQSVRYPALVLGVATSIVTYLLTRKLFGSERLALGTVLLFHLVPMFIAGSVLMTIDPPMFFCWALATYFAAIAIFDDRKGFWIGVGIAVGFGFLAKYAAVLWYIGLFGFLITQKNNRMLKGALTASAITALFALPVLIWNIQHDWVSFRHVAKQTGASEGAFQFLNIVELVASLIGLVGPTLFYLMAAAILFSISSTSPHRAKLSMLVWIGLSFLVINLIASFRTKVQANWPAPGFFTLLILTGYFISTRLQSVQTWKKWCGWFYASIVIAIFVIPVAHDTSVLLPLARPFVRAKFDLSRLDALARLRGWAALGKFVTNELNTLKPGAFVLCSDYQQTAEMAFYVQGQPATYCAGLYSGKRMSQYDVWPNRRLDGDSPLLGRDAVFVGKGGPLPDEIADVFERVEKQPELPVMAGGVMVKSYKTWRCYGFKGFPRPTQTRDY